MAISTSGTIFLGDKKLSEENLKYPFLFKIFHAKKYKKLLEYSKDINIKVVSKQYFSAIEYKQTSYNSDDHTKTIYRTIRSSFTGKSIEDIASRGVDQFIVYENSYITIPSNKEIDIKRLIRCIRKQKLFDNIQDVTLYIRRKNLKYIK